MVPESEPDLKLLGLSIRVDGRQFPGNSDFYDGTWLNLRVRMEASGATVKCAGPILMTSDFQRFRDQLISMDARSAGEATLAGYEPELKVTLKMERLGHLEGEVEITPDHLSQLHRFTLDLDQSYLRALIASCDAILERFPIVGAA
jgi:hypothetical protein